MAAYHIKFIKTVSDENAHSETVIRSMVINLARDAVRAGRRPNGGLNVLRM